MQKRRYHITGVNHQTREDVELVIEAASAADATEMAEIKGVAVKHVQICEKESLAVAAPPALSAEQKKKIGNLIRAFIDEGTTNFADVVTRLYDYFINRFGERGRSIVSQISPVLVGSWNAVREARPQWNLDQASGKVLDDVSNRRDRESGGAVSRPQEPAGPEPAEVPEARAQGDEGAVGGRGVRREDQAGVREQVEEADARAAPEGDGGRGDAARPLVPRRGVPRDADRHYVIPRDATIAPTGDVGKPEWELEGASNEVLHGGGDWLALALDAMDDMLVTDEGDATDANGSMRELISEVADRICQRVSRKTIRALQRDSAQQILDVDNVWDELCVQVQGEKSLRYQECEDAMGLTLRHFVNALESYELEAVWLCVPEAIRSIEFDTPSDPKLMGVAIYIWEEYLLSHAAKWSNQRIRAYLKNPNPFY